MNTKHAIQLAAAIATCSTFANAELITYDLQWSGLAFQNQATATGQVTIDTDLVLNPGVYIGEWEGSGFSDFSITITGANSGNGTFTSANNDFAAVAWAVHFGGPNPPLNLYTELVSQTYLIGFGVNNHPFEDDLPQTGNPLAPSHADLFTLQTSGAAAPRDLIQLVSMTPVPAPSSLALLGLSAMATTRRHR